MTIAARGRWQTPDEVFEALRQKGLLAQASAFPPFAAQTTSPRTPSSVPPPPPMGERVSGPLSRSAEAIARFMQLSGNRCLLAKVPLTAAAPDTLDDPSAAPQPIPVVVVENASAAPPAAPSAAPARTSLDCVITLLAGGSFVLAVGTDALEPWAALDMSVLGAAAREIGGRLLVYYIEEPQGEPPENVELISLRASVEPFVREALRSHAEMCSIGWPEEEEARIVPAYARLGTGLELPVEAALDRALNVSSRVVLLGDFGSGRSTQLLRRAASMASAYYENRAQRPCPLFLPLRGMKPDLSALLHEHVPGMSVEAFWLAAELDMVAVIFDGLDELTVLPAGLPEASAALLRLTEGARARVLVSASPAAFPSEASLLSITRGVPAEAVLTLRGLRKEEAMELLRRTVASDAEAEEMAEELEQIAALDRIAARPALLDVLAHRRRWLVPAGGVPSSAAIYAAAARDWLQVPGSQEVSATERPSVPPGSGGAASSASTASTRGSPSDRRLSAARALARELFRAGDEVATVDQITALLPVLGAAPPGAPPETGSDASRHRLAIEELRRSPFLVQTGPADELRFAHPSFQEYFLVADIAARIDEGREDALDLPRLTPEMVSLFTTIEGWSKRKKRLRDVLQQPYRPSVSENALLILYLAARAKVDGERLGRILTEELPCGAKLSGANLEGVALPWASLPEADLSGARLAGADLTCADLRGARLDGASAHHASFDGADLEWASMAGADLFSASFVNANLAQVAWDGAVTEAAVRISARLRPGQRATSGLDTHLDPVLRRVAESGPHMGQALALSPDGRWLAVARGFTVAVIDAFTGHVLSVLPGGASCALAVSFSPDGRYLVAASKDGAIRMWDAHRRALLRVVSTEPAWVMALAFSPDSETLVSASDNGPLRIWDVRRGEIIRSIDVRIAWFYAVAFGPDGDTFAAALADGTIRVWDARQGDVLRSIEGPAGPYMCLSFLPDGEGLATTSDDASIRVLGARSGDVVRVLRAPEVAGFEGGSSLPPIDFGGPTMAVAVAASGAAVASVASDGRAVIWDTRTGEIGCTIAAESACAVTFSTDGRSLYVTQIDGSINVADAKTGRILRTFKGQTSTVDSAVFSPAGDTIASASAGGDIRVWDARRGDLLHTLAGPAAMGTSLAFSLDGDTLAAAAVDGSIRLWDARRGELLRMLYDSSHHVTAVAFSLDGETLASGASDGSIGFWDARSGDLIRIVEQGPGRIAALAFSPDGDALAAAGDDGPVRVLDPRSGEILAVLEGHTAPVHSLVFLPDGATLASASGDGSIRLWDVREKTLTELVEGSTGPVHSLAFSPEGSTLAAASADGIVRLWDAAAGELLCTLEGHTASVSSVAFSLDGDMLVTASADGSVRVWRVADGRCLCVLLASGSAWATLVADGPFFIGGGDVSKLVRFTVSNSSMPASLWAPIFERPDLVAKALWGDIPSANALGLGTTDACEAALIEGRTRLGLARSRRDGPTAAIAVYKHTSPILAGVTLDDALRKEPRKLSTKRALTWIHLADLHFGAPKDAERHRFDQPAVMRAIARDVSECAAKPPDFVFVTGDIAWSGQSSEYEEARAWLTELMQAAGVTIDKLRLVPGNHDVDRSRANTKPTLRAHSEIRAAPEEIDNELSDAALRAALADKLGAYLDFVKAITPGHPRPLVNGLDWSERVASIAGANGKIRVAGLSTVWISDGSDGRLHKGQAVPFIRNMILGERQMREAFGDLDDDELLFLLTHHPPEWLHRDSAEEFAKALSRRAYVHLCGHFHDAPQGLGQKRFGVHSAAARYVAGAAHGDPSESRKHGYSWAAIRYNAAASQWEAGFSPRIYDEEREIMRPDAARYNLDEEGFAWEPIKVPWRPPVSVEIHA
ncbi:MAG TPA: pentapeptide repeat-containing protein [Polyangiaceae bacterium]|nr:pentapeptide repeat-containing protein [Polyangiaceae bacterium]